MVAQKNVSIEKKIEKELVKYRKHYYGLIECNRKGKRLLEIINNVNLSVYKRADAQNKFDNLKQKALDHKYYMEEQKEKLAKLREKL